MKNENKKTEMPLYNQTLREAAQLHLSKCGLPKRLIDGVDCSTFEDMERTLNEVKECFYSSIKKHIQETYGTNENPNLQWKQMEYKEAKWWEIMKSMNCDPENNKYITNLHSIINQEVQTGEFSKEYKQLREKEHLLEKILETGMNEEVLDKFRIYLELQGDIHGQVEKEGFIWGFRIAYHLLSECRR
ncbi:MAG: DUF6809 family protein [Anaerocolumna sp.]